MVENNNHDYHLLLDSLPDAVLLCDNEGIICNANLRCVELLGYQPEELVGKPVEILLPAEQRQHHAVLRMCYMHKPRCRPMSALQDIQARRKDGALQPVAIALSPVVLSSQQITIVCLRDAVPLLEARKREMEALERSLHKQRLENLGVLSSGIAHDFKNLLTVVLGNAELLMMKMGDSDPLRKFVRDIEFAAGYLRDMSRQILSYAGGKSAQRQRVQINDIVEEMSCLLKVSLPATTQLRLELGEGMPDLVADPVQVSQVLLNLILNANEAIGTVPGCITIRTGVEDARVYVEVQDTGCGIEAAVRDRILDPFFSTKSGGKGLGLSVVNGIVKQHGGSMAITSSLNAGASFRVCLPVG